MIFCNYGFCVMTDMLPNLLSLTLVFFGQAVELWIADKAVLPIENSAGGSIHRNYDLLLRHRLHIVGEVQLVNDLCLLALPGVRKEQLKRVISHSQVNLLISLLFSCFNLDKHSNNLLCTACVFSTIDS